MNTGPFVHGTVLHDDECRTKQRCLCVGLDYLFCCRECFLSRSCVYVSLSCTLYMRSHSEKQRAMSSFKLGNTDKNCTSMQHNVELFPLVIATKIRQPQAKWRALVVTLKLFFSPVHFCRNFHQFVVGHSNTQSWSFLVQIGQVLLLFIMTFAVCTRPWGESSFDSS